MYPLVTKDAINKPFNAQEEIDKIVNRNQDETLQYEPIVPLKDPNTPEIQPEAKVNPNGPLYDIFKNDQPEQDYYEEQERLKKIKKVGAVTDAFRLLADIVGKSKGATIQKRSYDPTIDTALSNVKRNITASKERGKQFTIAQALQKQKDAENAAKEKERREYDQTEFDRQLKSKTDADLGKIAARGQEAEDLALLRGDQRIGQLKYTQGQLNARQSKMLSAKEDVKAKTSSTTGKLYELTDEDAATPIARINEGGVDRLVSEIIKTPGLDKELDVMIAKYGDGVGNGAARRLFVQKFWRSTPELRDLGVKLDRSGEANVQQNQNSPNGAPSPKENEVLKLESDAIKDDPTLNKAVKIARITKKLTGKFPKEQIERILIAYGLKPEPKY